MIFYCSLHYNQDKWYAWRWYENKNPKICETVLVWLDVLLAYLISIPTLVYKSFENSLQPGWYQCTTTSHMFINILNKNDGWISMLITIWCSDGIAQSNRYINVYKHKITCMLYTGVCICPLGILAYTIRQIQNAVI